jgi:restriction endonuclease-like protein
VVTGKTELLRAQRRWADAHGVRYDARGFVRALADNLRAPLDESVLVEFQRGSELTPRATQPARAHSLCSSAALVVNVFAYWRGRDHSPLLEALGVGGPGGTRLEFEAPLPTGLPGDPPTVDVALYRPDGRIVAVESKFAEWLVPRPRGKRVFKDKYFAQGQRVWEAAGLPLAHALAEDLQAGRERPRYLNAAQILKHALGLAVNGLRTSTLLYLYYDRPGREAVTHRAEVDRVAARLAGELDLRVATYQSLFDALRASPKLDGAYVDYLARRYFA